MIHSTNFRYFVVILKRHSVRGRDIVFASFFLLYTCQYRYQYSDVHHRSDELMYYQYIVFECLWHQTRDCEGDKPGNELYEEKCANQHGNPAMQTIEICFGGFGVVMRTENGHKTNSTTNRSNRPSGNM